MDHRDPASREGRVRRIPPLVGVVDLDEVRAEETDASRREPRGRLVRTRETVLDVGAVALHVLLGLRAERFARRDDRVVRLALTALGRRRLEELSRAHLEELRYLAPALGGLLRATDSVLSREASA